jgi:NADPH:quinone reductase-like Zn-dependent oxidoreductase
MRAFVSRPQPEMEPEIVGSITLDGRTVEIALVELAPPEFDPDRPADAHAVLVEIVAFSCNYRDRAIIREWCPDLGIPPGFGSEFAGRVAGVGSAVTRFRIGDRVMADNSWPSARRPGVAPGVATNTASCTMLVLDEAKLVSIPATMSDVDAAAFTLNAQTANSMVRRSAPGPGDRVLVASATSNTALAVLQALRGCGGQVIATTTSAAHADALSRWADEVVVRERHDDWSRIAELALRIGGFTVALDPFADSQMAPILSVLSVYGRYASCGLAVQSPDLSSIAPAFEELWLSMITKNICALGNCLGTSADLERATARWSAGNWDVTVDKTFDTTEVIAFLERAYNDPGRLGKPVLVRF